MAGSAQTDDSGTMCEINVTPMVDVLLSLLIIFMVATPPPSKEQMPINVPQEATEQKPDDPNATLLVTIAADGKATLGETPLADDYDEMVKQFAANEKVQADGKVAVEADPKVNYGAVIRVMAAAHESGVMSVGLSSDRL
ncbi:MAG: biopolymer transporter ExbD [Nannocystaceae bacterium]